MSLKNMYFSFFVKILTSVAKLDLDEHLLDRNCLKYLINDTDHFSRSAEHEWNSLNSNQNVCHRFI